MLSENVSSVDANEIWQVRFVKPYEAAHNHVLLGRVLGTTEYGLRLDCIALHFGPNVVHARDIEVGRRRELIVPWGRIEVIHPYPADVDFASAHVEERGADIVIVAGEHVLPLVSGSEHLASY